SLLAPNHDHNDLGVTVTLNHQHVCALLPLRCPLDTRVTILGWRGYAPSHAAICAIELRPYCDLQGRPTHLRTPYNAQHHLTRAEEHVRAWEGAREHAGTDEMMHLDPPRIGIGDSP
ncbi:hypothetical protein FB107DRAFT_215440, partial [Schizophyllum commune]